MRPRRSEAGLSFVFDEKRFSESLHDEEEEEGEFEEEREGEFEEEREGEFEEEREGNLRRSGRGNLRRSGRGNSHFGSCFTFVFLI